MLAISVSDLDKDENLLNTPVATCNLKKGYAGEQPHDLITKMTICSPGEKGKLLWQDTLDIIESDASLSTIDAQLEELQQLL